MSKCRVRELKGIYNEVECVLSVYLYGGPSSSFLECWQRGKRRMTQAQLAAALYCGILLEFRVNVEYF